MLLLSILLAATVTTTQPTVISECQVTGTIQESKSMPAPEGAPERTSLKLMIDSTDEKCVGVFPKNTVVPFFITKNNIKPGDSFSVGTRLEASITYLYKDTASIKSYKIVTSEKQGPPVPTAQVVQNKESFITSIINAIKKLFGWK